MTRRSRVGLPICADSWAHKETSSQFCLTGDCVELCRSRGDGNPGLCTAILVRRRSSALPSALRNRPARRRVPSLVHAVEIDYADPCAFQLLDLVGYSKHEENNKNSKEVWSLYFVGERIDSALVVIVSAWLKIDRN